MHKAAERSPRAAVVVATNLRRSFGATTVLQGIDLEVARGEWVALMGPSGCGKSTLLQLVGGLDRPDSGHVDIAGVPMSSRNAAGRAELRREHVGFVFQYANLLSHLDARTNVEIAARLGGQGRAAARLRADELLASLGMSEHARSAPAHLSGGQQQRVAIARAIVNRPTVLLADEPTGSLDWASTQLALEQFRALHRTGQTIVMVTHDHAVAAQADRIISMRDGRVSDVEDRHPLLSRSLGISALHHPGFDDHSVVGSDGTW
jgi:putative ABC transport system ATP-binding protein